MSALRYERQLREWLSRERMGWERWSAAVAGGDTIFYRMGPVEPIGSVVLVHGAGNDALFAMTALIRQLVQRGFEVITYDLPGHGRASTTILDAERAVRTIPDAVEEAGLARRGVRPHLVGVSFGGALTIAELGRAPEGYRASAVVSTPLQIELDWSAIAGELRPRLAAALWRARRDSGLLGAIPSFGPFKRGVYPLRLANPAPPGSFGYVRSLNDIIAALDLLRRAREIRVPLLVAHGTGDRIAPIEQAAKLVATVPRAELLRLSGETHLTSLQAATPSVVKWLAGDAASFDA